MSTNANFGYSGFDLREVLLVKRVDDGDDLTHTTLHGLVGIGSPDVDGNYDNSFMRMSQEELDLSYSTATVSFINKSINHLTN